MADQTITYDQAVSFTNTLLELRKARPFSWQAGPGVTIRVMPHRELLSAQDERLRFCEGLELQTVRFDLEVTDGRALGKTVVYLSAGAWWSEGEQARFENGATHYLLLHDRLRRSAQQINLRKSLFQRAGQLRLHVLPRFPKGGAELSQRLRRWLKDNAPVTIRGKQVDVGLSSNLEQLLRNLLLLVLAKQHLRGVAYFRSWMETLPPSVGATEGFAVTTSIDADNDVASDAAVTLLEDDELDDETEETPEVWTGLRLVDPPRASRSRRRKGGGGKVNFEEIRNLAKVIGRAGERLVLEEERAELVRNGRPDLADKVQHVAAENDGAGYDILSFTPSGRRIYIEVKTTTGGEQTAFVLTANELAFSQKHKRSYRLYRLFGYTENPERASMFILEGDLSEQVEMAPTQFRAWVKGKKRRGGSRG